MRRLNPLRAAARLRRIARFVDDFTHVLEERCKQCAVDPAGIEGFINDMYWKMSKSREEFSVVELALMLADETTRTRVFLKYRDRL